jgi:hypothetical protein
MVGHSPGRPFSHAASAVLMAVAVAHALRAAFQLPLLIGSVTVPPWMSVPGAVVAGALSILVWREAGRG